MHSVPYAKETLLVLLGYGLGCLTSGYYLVRWRTGEDVRFIGSGSVGASAIGEKCKGLRARRLPTIGWGRGPPSFE